MTVVDKYVVETAAGKEFLDSNELFARVDDGLRVQVKGLQDQCPICEVFWQDEGEVCVRGPIPGGDPDHVCHCVDRITVQDFQDQLSKMYEEEKMTEYDRVREQMSSWNSLKIGQI